MIRSYNEKYKSIQKYFGVKKLTTSTLEAKLITFQNDTDKLFDISSCKCASFDKCSCPNTKKVPEIERSFLLDQRTLRKMFIGAVDLKETEKMRKQKETERVIFKRNVSSSTTQSRIASPDQDSDEDYRNPDNDKDSFKPSPYTASLIQSEREKTL